MHCRIPVKRVVRRQRTQLSKPKSLIGRIPEPQGADPGFCEVKGGCFGDFKPFKRHLSRGLQMLWQVFFFLPRTGFWLVKNLKRENGLLTIEYLNITTNEFKNSDCPTFGISYICFAFFSFTFFWHVKLGFLAVSFWLKKALYFDGSFSSFCDIWTSSSLPFLTLWIRVLALAPLFYSFFSFIFINRWLNKGKLPLTASLPSVEMAFLVRCYANCLQPWSSKVSDVVILFLASASGTACCVRASMCVRVCLCVHACAYNDNGR